MFLTKEEMTMLCVFHAGTVSETLALLKEAKNEPPERMAVVEKLISVLSDLKPGQAVSLAFDSEG